MTRFTKFKGHFHNTTKNFKTKIPKMRDIKNLDEKKLSTKRYTKSSSTEEVTYHHNKLHNRKDTLAPPFHKKDISMQFSVRTAILVPSTYNDAAGKSHSISPQEHERRVEEVRKFLSRHNAGYTSINATGGYTMNGKVIEEPVTEVVAYRTKEEFNQRIPETENFIRKKRREWRQDSIGYEEDEGAKLYYFKPNAKKKV